MLGLANLGQGKPNEGISENRKQWNEGTEIKKTSIFG